jgi:glycosyltransferase involved in cell wall biosynthesis
MQGTASFKSPLSVLVTGTSLFLRRHGHIFQALAPHFAHLDYLPARDVSHFHRAAYKLGSILCQRAPRRVNSALERLAAMHPWDARVFIARSLQLESQIASLPNVPDLILHVFGMYCPFWARPSVPYAMLLDYTEALANRNWRDWAPFATEASLRARLLCERRAYHNAVHLFPFGNGTRRSLIEDYGVDPAKITVIGSSGHFADPYPDHQPFGSKRILFYCGDGPDFYRKGGDRVLAAFRIVRQQIPDAKLAIVGMSSEIADPGVVNHGYVSSPEKMRELFLSSDLVLAPARCDPFPTFLIEAMNFGVPCVTSDADGMPEIVAHELTGLVISNVSAPDLAVEVVRLLNDTQRLVEMSRRARERASEKFSSAHVARIVAEAIQNLPIHPTVDRKPNLNIAPLLETSGS